VVTVGVEPVYCYINGPHFHAFAAPEIPDYQVRDGVAFYVGAYPPQYVKMKPARVRLVNAEYRPYVALRPTVVVAPPPEWQGEVWVAPPSVAVRAPGVGVQVTAPGVVIAAPPPPRVEVVVGAPGIVVGAPGAVYVDGPRGGRYEREHDDDDEKHWRKEEKRERHEEEHWHHDNGKHNGWGKHGRDD
jgi:hypothetical protein